MAMKGWKLEIVRSVVKTIRDQNGRFLARRGNYWYDIGDQKAIGKTAQAFRDLRLSADDISSAASAPAALAAPSSSNPEQSVVDDAPLFPRKIKHGGRLGVFVNRLYSSASEIAMRPRAHSDDTGISELSSPQEDPPELLDEEGPHPMDIEGDVSETETEDSFPAFRGRARQRGLFSEDK